MLKKEEFQSLSPAEKRVAIAKDVLQQVKLNKYVPQTNVWVYLLEGVPITSKTINMSLQKLLKKHECEVCAIGGLIASSIRLGNELSVMDCLDQEVSIYDKSIINNKINNSFNFNFSEIHYVNKNVAKHLKKYFSPSQIKLMEVAFEGTNGYFGFSLTVKEQRALDFYETYVESEEYRLCAIMENVIKNNGTFKP